MALADGMSLSQIDLHNASALPHESSAGNLHRGAAEEGAFAPEEKYKTFIDLFKSTVPNPELREVLELNEAQWQKLVAVLDDLVRKAGDLQEGSSYAAVKILNGRPTPILYLKPIPEKWKGVREEFANSLKDVLGSGKADFLLQAGKQQFAILTGDFGTMPRSMLFLDRRLEKDDDPEMPDWMIMASGGRTEGLEVAHYFPDDIQAVFNDRGSSSLASVASNFNIDENEIPPYFQPLIDVQKDLQNK